MVRAVSLALLIQLGAFVAAGVTLAFGVDARIDAKIKNALVSYTTRLDVVQDDQRLERELAELKSEVRLLRAQLGLK